LKSVSENQASLQPFELLLDQRRIKKRIEELGKAITAVYVDKSVLVLGMLKGCFVFMADLIRYIKLDMDVDFFATPTAHTGYRAETDISFASGVTPEIKGRHILIVEGIVDSGRTASLLMKKLRKLEPATVEIVTLLDKPASHRTKMKIKYKGFSIGNDFVIGFGLDNMQKYRNLPFIGRMIDE
jgi:hypoxanthine phosphoribosyltransferase